ncbi:MAG: hypothetical protein JXA08_09165 [Methanomicrobiaceae archaeon]|nr:hypothetical protein [Methanomicrobiaceae archaeon]
MTARKKELASAALGVWLLVVLLFMILARTLNLEIFFVLWLIGLLVVVELIDPPSIEPAYIRNLKYLVAAGVVIFGVIVAEKVLEILNL